MARIGSVLLATVLLLGLSSASAEPVTLVALGDSLTVGDGDEAGGGYPSRLLAKLSKEAPGSTLENLAQSGWTSDDLINTQLEPAVAALHAAPGDAPKLVLAWIGSNDLLGLYNYVCREDYGNDCARCEPETLPVFTNNIEAILCAVSPRTAFRLQL